MNKAQVFSSVLIVGLLLVCTWMVANMSDKLDGPRRGTGQEFSGDGVTTERWKMQSGEPEPLADWLARHQEAVRALQGGE